MYLIAASQLGEEVLDLPEMEKVRKIINTELDKMLEQAPSEDQ